MFLRRSVRTEKSVAIFYFVQGEWLVLPWKLLWSRRRAARPSRPAGQPRRVTRWIDWWHCAASTSTAPRLSPGSSLETIVIRNWSREQNYDGGLFIQYQQQSSWKGIILLKTITSSLSQVLVQKILGCAKFRDSEIASRKKCNFCTWALYFNMLSVHFIS